MHRINNTNNTNKNGTLSFFTFSSSLIQIYQLIFGNKNFRDIVATESSMILLLGDRPMTQYSSCFHMHSDQWSILDYGSANILNTTHVMDLECSTIMRKTPTTCLVARGNNW